MSTDRRALDKGEVALAQTHGLYIPIGELNDRQLNRLAAARFAKAGFNPDQPRLPQGDPHGGEWTTGDGDSGPFDALDPKPLDALRLEPRDLAGLTEGNIHPRSLADLAITQPGDPFPTGGDIQPPQPPAQSTTMESGDTSPTSAARSRTTEPRSPDLLPLRYEMAPRSAPPTVGSAGNAGADGGTSTIGEGAAASRETPRIDAINSDYSIEELLFPAGKVLIARALEAGVFPGMGMP